jgi:hypothetical protein
MDIIPPITADLNTSLPIKYILCALIAGGANKIYDDIEDNFRLEQFKTAHNMEMLKGIHYVTFTILGIAYPLFFIITYGTIFMNKITTPSSYVLPYENSLFYSFALIFLFLDYSKIFRFSNIDFYYIVIICIAVAFGEVYNDIALKFVNKFYNFKYCDLLIAHEVSHFKLIVRFSSIIALIIYCYYSTSSVIKSCALYIIAYAFVSCCTQFYSLYIYKPPQPIEVPPIIQEKKEETEETFEQPEVKEDPNPPIITSVSQV